VHWARLEASALGSLIAACPAWKKEEERRATQKQLENSCNTKLIGTLT